jgi:hypothetical protein
LEENFFLSFGKKKHESLWYSIGMTIKSESFIQPSRYQDEFLVKILAFYGASFGCYDVDSRTEYPNLIPLEVKKKKPLIVSFAKFSPIKTYDLYTTDLPP